MRRVPIEEFRFQLRFELGRLPRSILRDLQGSTDKRELALQLASEAMSARFARYEIKAPDPSR